MHSQASAGSAGRCSRRLFGKQIGAARSSSRACPDPDPERSEGKGKGPVFCDVRPRAAPPALIGSRVFFGDFIMIRMRSFAAAALAAAFVLSVPTASHAQLGGALKRAAKKKAEDALKGKPEKPADTAAPAATPAADAGRRGRAAENFGSTSATPKFDATTIEITAPVVDRFLTGMAAEQKARQAFAKDQAKGAEYEATIDKYERCVQKKMEERNAGNRAARRALHELLAGRDA